MIVQSDVITRLGGRDIEMKSKLKIATWVAAVAVTPACATMSFEPPEIQAKRTADSRLTVEQQSLRASVDTLKSSIHGCGIPESRDMMEVIQGGLRDFIYGFDRNDRETPQDPAVVYLQTKIAADSEENALVVDIDSARHALHDVNLAAADLARETRGEGLTLADVREMEHAVAEAQRALRIFENAAEAVDLSEAAAQAVNEAVANFERELTSASKIADALGALQSNTARFTGVNVS